MAVLAGLTGSTGASETCAQLIEQSNNQLEAMRRHAGAIEASLKKLGDALLRAEERHAEQTRHIEGLEAELGARRVSSHPHQARQRMEFLHALRRLLPRSSLYEVLPDRLIIASDPVFIFGKGELGAEGQERLLPLVKALRELVARLPGDIPWRLRVEGHSDSRPVRTNRRFDTNWELSATRAAVPVVR